MEQRNTHAIPISVALCTRNGARFIAEQLDSIFAQTVLPREIVLSDDASTDDTVWVAREAVERFRGQQPDVSLDFSIIENSVALGVTKNFQQAVLATRGELVILCDQDDLWHAQRVERIVAEFERRNLLLLHGDARLVAADGRAIGHTLFEALDVTKRERRAVHADGAFDVYLRRNLATGATTVIRRPLVEFAAAFPPEWLHDEWLAIIAAAVGEVDFIEEALLDYRQHGDNEIGASKLSVRGKFRRLMEPRGARNERLARNAQILVDRLSALGDRVPDAKLRRAEGKLAHEGFRVKLPAQRLRRIVPVWREARRGGYTEYGRGVPDLLRDLVQPAR